MSGVSKPEQFTFNTTQETVEKYEVIEDIGEEVTHVYQVTNKGPSRINEAEVYILWPSFDANGDDLLYLTGLEYDRSKATCQPFNNLNPLSLKVNLETDRCSNDGRTHTDIEICRDPFALKGDRESENERERVCVSVSEREA